MRDIEYVSTPEIRVGDVLLCHGMMLLIDQEPQRTRHPGGNTFATDALVTNWDDVQAMGDRLLVGFIRSDMAAESHRTRNGLAPYTEPRWTIQGNGLATWARVIKEDN